MTYDIAVTGGEQTQWTDRITVVRRVHPLYLEWLSYKDNPIISARMRESPLSGKWHYLYKSEKGEISLVELLDYFRDGSDLWEIWSGGKILDDVERFSSKEEAEVRIRELLE